ncbi:MAG TPA: tryptophan dimethylallyltransferase family protein [Polyangiaceae bacterium]|nr:tryptophan dimethylallyltransferase family protein [Polyangiaceae bacterium]
MRLKTPSTAPGPLQTAAVDVEGVDGKPPRRTASVLVPRLVARLSRLCAATGLSSESAAVAERVLRDLIVPWSRVETFVQTPHTSWVSDISDDNTPIEMSVTLSPIGNEVRILFEPQAEAGTLQAHREAALRMHAELERDYAASLDRFRLIQDLFVPPDMQGPFALWSAVAFAEGKPPSFKAYFNPQAQGIGSAVTLVEEALRRLGLHGAWAHLAATLARRGPHYDELKYFALDLSASEHARVKVYVRHHEATAEDLEVAASAAPDFIPGEAREFARAMGGGTPRFTERATFTCAAFTGNDEGRPAATTQYFPVCAYAGDDLEVEERVAGYLRANGMDDTPYRKMLSAFADRPLDAGVGMQSWVAFRRLHGVPRLTVYLGTETRCVFAPGSVPAGTRDHMAFDSAKGVLECAARYELSEHPLVRGLTRAGAARAILWLLVCNTLELLSSTTDASAQRLATWLADHAAHERELDPSQSACKHLFAEALDELQTSADSAQASAALMTARAAAKSLAKTLAELVETEETSSVAFSLDAILKDGVDAEASRLEELERLGQTRLRSIVRGALGVHQRLWVALDRLYALRPA